MFKEKNIIKQVNCNSEEQPTSLPDPSFIIMLVRQRYMDSEDTKSPAVQLREAIPNT